ncbi:coatomer epsilon subunit-domain-containing protein [Kickxella alabastrina]|uniref:coatomer epsilon subunit-domain-containing protein n=1 Tax=Kickxella alabastrina TaxID=61397 RepID=UPI00221F9253|nr:coatomer epsilon subunit-domain-containing protein [Kickxella alabastrina]KAI7831060.1 coatomer epsilon subunit-domain-containing protein [Kickxella alabastrina]
MSEAVVDDFYTARNLLYLGAYPQALSNLTHLRSNTAAWEFDVEKKSLQYRSYLGQGKHQQVLDEIPTTPSTPATLQALRHLTAFKYTAGDQRDAATAAITELVSVPENLLSGTFVAIAAQRHDEALSILAMHSKNLECSLMTTAILLSIDRVDLAQKTDAPLAQLAEAWTALHVGGQKYTEALYIFEELAQAAAVSTARVVCALAVCKMHLGLVTEAMAMLQDALERDQGDADVLANLVVCANILALPLETKDHIWVC